MKFEIKRICCIGAGYVGGPTMAVIADKCSNIRVTVLDINHQRILNWNDNDLSNLPVYEPGLDEIIKRCRGVNLFFSTKIKEEIALADMIFLSVNTPTKTKGIGAGQASDLKWIESSTRQIASYAKGKTIVVEKSTLPVRTAQTIKLILEAQNENKSIGENNNQFYILSNPEFLAEGTAINDLERPDRVLIGGEDQSAIDALARVYENWIDPKKILRTNLWSSELSKLTANAFLAQRISSINSISGLCEKTGADIREVAQAIGMDRRIGSDFLKSGPGFGGSCFKKDILNLIYICNHYGLHEVGEYWEGVIKINSWQQNRITKIIINKLFGTVAEKYIAILGFSFKSNTNDTRESPAIKICNDLINEGAKLKIYDPKVSEKKIELDLNLKNPNSNESYPNGSWVYSPTILDAAKGVDGIVIMTDWDEFKDINWNELYQYTRKPTWLFDSRNICDKDKAKKANIKVWELGSSHTE
tara:strand:- start:1590 stop:3011 length:1422 start_codon:yes stop_codon:yes gene_type:complete